MDYAIIKLGNKQHRVRHGETLVVDRLPTDEGQSFEPVVLLGDARVTATVVAHERGPKIVIGKYRKRTGYKRHNGFRAATSRVEIALGSGAAARADRPVEAARQARAVPEVEAAPEVPEPPEIEVTAPGLPEGYDHLTVAQIASGTKEWTREQIEAALAFEQAHAGRKGAVSALESALAKEDD